MSVGRTDAMGRLVTAGRGDRLVYCVMSVKSRSIKIEIESAYGDTVEGETGTLYLCW